MAGAAYVYSEHRRSVAEESLLRWGMENEPPAHEREQRRIAREEAERVLSEHRR